jgi:hypothetical protein
MPSSIRNLKDTRPPPWKDIAGGFVGLGALTTVQSRRACSAALRTTLRTESGYFTSPKLVHLAGHAR